MQILILIFSKHPPHPGPQIGVPSWSFWPPLFHRAHKGLWKANSPQETLGGIQIPPLRNCKVLCSTVSCAATAAILSGLALLPAAPAMCSSTLSRSSHAAGWMSPYISSVRIGAALISSDKGAGERLITCNKPRHALGLSCANYPQGRTHSVISPWFGSANYPPITSRFIHFRKCSVERCGFQPILKTQCFQAIS